MTEAVKSAAVTRRRAPDVARDAEREFAAAAELRAQILALAEGDEDFARDAVEGQTDVREIIACLVASDAEDGHVIDGISDLMSKLTDRKARIKRRIELRRALILQGLSVAGLRKLETPAGTASIKPLPPSVIVMEEADIPVAFWKTADPTIDKRALLAALKEGPVAGATLSNGSETVSVRF